MTTIRRRTGVALAIVFAIVLSLIAPTESEAARSGAPYLASLRQLSVDTLRDRQFGSELALEEQLGSADGSSEYSQHYGAPYYDTFMASYGSDRLRVYTRVDVPPTPMPADGYPVIIFAHGWVGATGAPGYTFNYSADSYYGDMLDAYVKAGYVVLMPGFRGHGTVNGVPAEGLEYIEAYDNGSYLSPIFYGVDILNLLESVETLDQLDWSEWGRDGITVDTDRIHLTGHSQGGDAAFSALAVSSSWKVDNKVAAASIWAGSVEGRVEQGAFFGPQETSIDAKTDPAYFPHMPSWWSDSWYWGSIQDGIDWRRDEMYDTASTYVRNQKRADMSRNSLAGVMASIDASKHLHYIDMPLDLHYSDMDHYSIPEWNETVVRGVRGFGGKASAHLYEGNSHEFRVIDGWSPPGAVEGRGVAIANTIALFDSTS